MLHPHHKQTCSSLKLLQQKQRRSESVNREAHVNAVRERAASGRLRHYNRRRLSGVGTGRLLVRRRRRLVEARRQAGALLDIDLEGQTALALHAVAGVGEEVVWSNYSQRYGNGQRCAETTASAAVHEGTVVAILGGAVQIGRLVVSLNHRLIGVRIEN